MRQKQDLLSQSLECYKSTFAREKKRKRTTVQADSQGHVSHYHELMSRVWPVNAYFLMQPATRLCGTLTRKGSLTFILFFLVKCSLSLFKLLQSTIKIK